jgi:hypothetical protein
MLAFEANGTRAAQSRQHLRDFPTEEAGPAGDLASTKGRLVRNLVAVLKPLVAPIACSALALND